MSRRLCFALDLVNDVTLIREYCRWHEPGSEFQRGLHDAAADEKWAAMPRSFLLADTGR